MDDEREQIVRAVIRRLEIPPDFPEVCVALALMALLILAGYFELRWLDPAKETQFALGLLNAR
jgi:hypothetical protein